MGDGCSKIATGTKDGLEKFKTIEIRILRKMNCMRTDNRAVFASDGLEQQLFHTPFPAWIS
eukprot:1143393-Pelagomonas_calceolata.AAC.5